MAAGMAAVDTTVPFPRDAAKLVLPGSGSIEPTAIPAAPATTNAVILRTASDYRVMAASDSPA